MIKRTMYFYDKKQANVISKLNDNLHKQRGIHIKDKNILKDLAEDVDAILQFYVANNNLIADPFAKKLKRDAADVVNMSRKKAIDELYNHTRDLKNGILKLLSKGDGGYDNGLHKSIEKLYAAVNNEFNSKNKTRDADDTINNIFVNEVISKLTRQLKKLEDDASKIQIAIKEIKNAKDTKSLNNILQSIKGFI